jgi:hypothetical protein
MMSAATSNEYLPNGTPVLNTTDGETGSIINGFAADAARGWYEYEVATHYGIERWQRSEMLPVSELETEG